jgi:hypothetical protein
MNLQPSYSALKALMSHQNPSIREEGFDLLRDRAAEFAESLIADFEDGNYDDSRYWFLELIVASQSPAALAVLVGELSHPTLSFRQLAAEGLKALATPESIAALVAAGVDLSIDPWEQDISQQPPR